MRTLQPAILLAVLTTSACAVWNPDYERDPDAALRAALPATTAAGALDAVQLERAQFAVERLATRFPDHVACQAAAAALAMDRGQTQRARGYAERAIELEPGNVSARCVRVRVAVDDGSLDLARKLVDDGLRLRPDAAALYESSAWLHQLDGSHDDALRALDAAEGLGAPDWRVAHHRGLIEELRGAFRAAASHYEDALAKNPECTDARRRLSGLTAQRKLQSGR